MVAVLDEPVVGMEDAVAEPAALSTERLEFQIANQAGHLAAATCRWLLLVAEYDRRKGWEAWELRSCAHWLEWKCELSSSTAREHVRVARALESLPLVRGAFAQGAISYSKVRALTRVLMHDTSPETEKE